MVKLVLVCRTQAEGGAGFSHVEWRNICYSPAFQKHSLRIYYLYWMLNLNYFDLHFCFCFCLVSGESHRDLERETYWCWSDLDQATLNCWDKFQICPLFKTKLTGLSLQNLWLSFRLSFFFLFFFVELGRTCFFSLDEAGSFGQFSYERR